MPKVSVLTPIYKTHPEHLRECIESILNQTFTDFEFLILNDSPDATYLAEIVKSYKDKRIKYIENEHNMGISASRNKLLHMARGEYLAVFDHDDISVPTRLAQEVEFLDANPHIGVVSGMLEFFGDKNCKVYVPEHDIDILVGLTDNCIVAHTAAMIRKSVLIDNAIEYEEFYTPAEDWRLWARLMQVTHFHNIQETLVQYRWFAQNTTKTMNTRMQLSSMAVKLYLHNTYPEYWHEFQRRNTQKSGTHFRLRLFGFIPLFKIKNDWIQLFEFIPMLKIKRK